MKHVIQLTNLDVRQAIAQHVSTALGIDVDPNSVILTTSGEYDTVSPDGAEITLPLVEKQKRLIGNLPTPEFKELQ